ncbi:MAG: photosystem II protein PsbQ [Synechococcus sp.]|nr:photosystem II protein PsbQ [Synechococcus sp.]
MVSALASVLRRLAALALAFVLCFGVVSAAEAKGKAAATISPDDMALIRRQAEGFLAAKERLPELATLVNEKNWVFTRNLIHGPMQDLGREMLYINQRLLPGDRAEANKRADALKDALAGLDEAARLQDGPRLSKEYIKVASGFGSYAEVIPAAALN